MGEEVVIVEVIDFFERCVPPMRTAQQKRVNHKTGVFFHDAKAKAALGTWDALIWNHRPPAPIMGATYVTVYLCWPWRKSETKRRIALGSVPHTSQPDLDNYVKALIDRLVVHRFIENDQSIAELTVRKRWGDDPGVGVRIERIAE